MAEYRQYLAEQLLTEEKVVTYRYLSRALGVHVHTAKQMLYEFHSSQNRKKSGSVHATYLIYGVKSRDESRNHHVGHDGDVEMTTSSMPEVESDAEHVPVYTLSLIGESGLADCLEQYDEVTSIHVYSVGSQPVNDSSLLSDTVRQVLDLTTGEDPIHSCEKYGAIINPSVRRRDREVPAVISSAPTAQAAKQPQTDRAPASSTSSSAAVKEEPKSQIAAAFGSKPAATSPSSTAAPAASAEKKSAPTPALKRGGSGIMQAFAKAAAKPPPKKKEAAATTAAEEEGMSDDGEDDSESLPAPAPKRSGQAAAGQKTRKEREEELRRMMEDEEEEADKEEEDEEEEKEEEPEEDHADTPMDGVDGDEAAPPGSTAASAAEEPAEVVSGSTGDGRRRGKRRVMRKKQIMDDQGYLVTLQEPGWESFSEDEAPAASLSSTAKTAKPPASTSSQEAKTKKAASKGQGNIMSFFGKK